MIPREPLTPEERELAARLARLGPPAAPSTALDARILAAAHAAVAGRARRRRWPIAAGAAATLALAVGVAWQLRPMQDTARSYSEAPASAPAAQRPAADAAPEFPIAADTEGAPSPAAGSLPPPSPPPSAASSPALEPTPEMASTPAARRGDAERTHATTPTDAARRDESVAALRREDRQRAAQTSARPEPAPTESTPPPPAAKPRTEVVFDLPAPPPPAPAAPIALPAPAPAAGAESAASTAPARMAQAEKTARSARKQDAAAPERFEANDGVIERDNAGFTDQALDDQPPATADSPEVQRAWLQRIRELLADGETEAARASAVEFKRRYPRFALPEDLRELVPSTPP